MRVERKLKGLVFIELAALLALTLGMINLAPDRAAKLRLYEFFGALTASTITTFGIWKMRQLT